MTTAIFQALRPITFKGWIDLNVREAIERGASDFNELLRVLPSIYPTEVLDAVGRLSSRPDLNQRTLQRILASAAIRPAPADQISALVTVPHPLDFEWRFTSRTSRQLLTIAEGLANRGRLLLLGTPGIALEAIGFDSQMDIVFVGENNCVLHRIAKINWSAGSPLIVEPCTNWIPNPVADVVILDPPWYPDFTGPMIKTASAACKVGGVVLMSCPSAGTRETAADDCRTLLGTALQSHLELTEQIPLATQYETPFFERNALSAVGVFTTGTWRRGDLMIFRKIRQQASDLLRIPQPRSPWIEASIGRMRIRVKRSPRAHVGYNGILPLLPGDILPSVSRRDPVRREAEVWTSGNRVFRTDNPALLIAAALAAGGDDKPQFRSMALSGTLQSSEAIERIAHALRELASAEASEERGVASTGFNWGNLAD